MVTMTSSLLASRTPASRPRRMLAALTAALVAVSASVFGAALPASAAGTASISGTVTSSAGGAPIEGITVTWFVFDEFGSAAGGLSTVTAVDGTFTLENLDAGEYTLGFSDPDEGFLSTYLGGDPDINNSGRVMLADAEVLTGIDETLDPAGSVSGTVTDSVTSEPLEGIEVFATYFGDEGGYFSSALTAADGTYTLTGMFPAASWTVGFDGRADGYSILYYDGVREEFLATPVSVVGGQTTSGIDAALQEGGTVTGSVALASNPVINVEGIDIELVDNFGNTQSATTQFDGSFELLAVTPGDYRLRAIGSGGLLTRWWDGAITIDTAEVITVAAGQTVSGIDLLLEEAGAITGYVTGPLGEPLESVEVQADPVIGLDILYAVTDEFGEYRFDGVASTDYLISYYPPASQNIRSQFWPGSDLRSGATPVAGVAADTVSDIDIQLPAGAIISGTVFDDIDVVEGIEVYVESLSMQVGRYTTSDSNGDWIVRGLPSADDYLVQFVDWTDIYVDQWYSGEASRDDADALTLQAGSTLGDIDATLVRAATVTGQVVDELGEGIPDVQVWFAPGGSFGDDLYTATTASDGVYELIGLAPGSYRVLTGGVFNSPQEYRTEWFDSVYDPQVSDDIDLAAGEQLVGFDIELLENSDPEPPAAVTVDILDEESGYPTFDFTLPESADGFAFGLFASLNFGNNGDGYLGSFFDPLQWSLADDWDGYDGHGRLMVQAFNADGFGPAVRELVTVGDGPGIPSTPEPQFVAADGTSFTVSWSIDEVGDGVDYWGWDIFTVDEPGEPYLQTGYEEADDPFSDTQTISGLEPETDYEIFVMGFDDDSGENTFWGRGIFTTTDGPEILGLTQTPTPTITGGPRLGGVLAANAGVWNPGPVVLEYQWLRNGAAIGGANSTTYEPTVADLGAEISVRVTGSKTGYVTVSRTSEPTAPVVDLSTLTDERLAGGDRYATAAAISGQYASDVDVLYIATGTNYPDALSAAAAAAYLGAPLLLTLPTRIPDVIADEVVRLNPDVIVVTGSATVVSNAVYAELQALVPGATMRRDAGTSRYDTSRIIAERAFPADTTTTAYIATGRNFPDALSASSAAGSQGAPVILVNGLAPTLDAPTEALLADLGVERVVIAGSGLVVSAGIETRLNTLFGSENVSRQAGPSRFDTSVAINVDRFDSADIVYLANGLGFADSMGGAALAGRGDDPLFIVPKNCVPDAVLDQIAALGATKYVLLGSSVVLTSAVENLTPC